MALAQPWVLLVAAALLVAAVTVGLIVGLRRRGTDRADGTPLSRAERIRALPSFAHAVRVRQVALSSVLVLAAAGAVVAGVVAARPLISQTIQPVNSNRDIMLCLDVSGSMDDVDVEVLDVFIDLLSGFRGERIGLTIFNSSPVQIFPLTDDYAFVRSHLESLRDSFDYTQATPEHWAGTLNGAGASLIGDGLASCAMRFDHLEDERSRSVIFASDNEVNGASIVTVPEAAQFAKDSGVRVYAINPVAGADPVVTAELRDAAELTGGAMYDLRGETTVTDIIDEVQAQQASQLRGQAQIVETDAPEGWMAGLVVLAAGCVFVTWRLRL